LRMVFLTSRAKSIVNGNPDFRGAPAGLGTKSV
jgi:hypothetical protein